MQDSVTSTRSLQTPLLDVQRSRLVIMGDCLAFLMDTWLLRWGSTMMCQAMMRCFSQSNCSSAPA
jgi:hypothetical protein